MINHLLRHPEGRRIGVIVNDFGSIGIDADLLGDGLDPGYGQIVSLPNGCVCCTIGSGLHDALAGLAVIDAPLDHIVVEVSGVADPASAAAWATVPPFEPGGIVVLAAADSVRSMARDRYVGGEVLRQLAGADLIVVTKSDLCEPAELAVLDRWLDEATGGSPRVAVVGGVVPPSVILGIEPGRVEGQSRRDSTDPDHSDRYVTWDWSGHSDVSPAALADFLAALPAGVLRLKGWIRLDGGTTVVVQRVGDRSTVRPGHPGPRDGLSALVAVGVRDLLDTNTLTHLADIHLH